MAKHLISLDRGGSGFSPFVDVAINGMAAMFVFLAVYVAAVPPRSGDPPPLQLVTRQVPQAVWLVGYEAPIGASGGNGGYTFTIEPMDALAEVGLLFDDSDGAGRLVGTPTPPTPDGRHDPLRLRFSITVTDQGGQSDSRDFHLHVAPVAIPFDPEAHRLRWATTALDIPDAWIGQPYEYTPGVLGGIEPYEAAAEGLPRGLTLTEGGFVGTPQPADVPGDAEFEDYTIAVTVTDQQSALLPAEAVRDPRLMATYRLRVRRIPPIRPFDALPSLARPGQPYRGAVVCTGGRGVPTWQVAQGELPRGLHLDAHTGVISGTVDADLTRAGIPVTARFRIEIDDEHDSTPPATLNCAINVLPPMRFSWPE